MIGNEPPLSVDGEVGELDHRRISVHWFSGTILTGLCGAALMGGAVFAALDGEANFAAAPEWYEMGLRGTLTQAERGTGRKADRLPSANESVAARKVIRVSTMNRVGDREVVRVRPYMRVAANLSLSVTEVSAGVPPFNPQKLLADPGTATDPNEEARRAAPDAAVSFVTRDLSSVLPRAKVALTIPLEEVVARVREAANWTGASSAKYASADFTGATVRLAYAAEGDIDLYAGFEARIIPENVTLLPKTAAQATGGGASANERVVTAKKTDSVATILRELGATADEIKAIVGLLGPRGRDGSLRDGQKLRVLLTPVAGASRLQPARVTLMGDASAEAIVALSDLGKYVAVDVQSADTQVADAEDEDDDGTGVRLYQSLYETALRNHIPRPVIDDMVRIYSYDVDFQRRAQPGDAFEVLYTGEEDNAGAARQEVLFASLTVGGEVKRFYRFQSPDDSIVDYYDETGKSAKKFLVRKPLANGLMRSGFGTRNHPLLGYTKMHTGVDWSAPMGTPVFASGNGTIEKVGWESGYGKYIRIKHANGYQTAYGHLTAYARSSTEGARVRQGQVIGFVGSTGLSTGAHLHYEILVNGRFVDPMRVRLPRGRALEGGILASFERERDRIDTMTTRQPARVAASGPAAGKAR